MYEQGHFIQHIIFVKCFCSDFSCWFVDLLIFTGSCCSCGSGAGDGLIGNLLTPVRWLCLIRGGPLISAIWGIQMCWSCVPKSTLKNQSCSLKNVKKKLFWRMSWPLVSTLKYTVIFKLHVFKYDSCTFSGLLNNSFLRETDINLKV